jgi:hypothetical protein
MRDVRDGRDAREVAPTRAPTEIEAPRVVGRDCANRLVGAADVSSENALVGAALAGRGSGEITGRDGALASA